MVLTRDEILAARDIRVERVEVPEWGGEVLVRGLTAAERDEFDLSATVERDGKRVINFQQLRARLVAMSLVDEHGKRLFSDADVEYLAAKSGAAIGRIFDIAMRLSGLTGQDIEEITRNFTATPPGVSPSA